MATKAANKKDLEKLRDLLPQGVNPRDTVWDCHGTWVMYHRYIEQIAAHKAAYADKGKINGTT